MPLGPYHDVSVKSHYDAEGDVIVERLEAVDPPPIGARSAFSLHLLAAAEHGVGVDDQGRLLVLGMVFKVVGLDPGNNQFGPPQSLVGERVA